MYIHCVSKTVEACMYPKYQQSCDIKWHCMDHKLVTLNKKVHNIQFDNKYKETY